MRKNSRYSSLIKKDRQYLWHPFTHINEWQKEEITIVEQGKGPYLIDVLGKKYIDGVSSLWCNVWGHRFKPLDRAIISQLTKIEHSTLLGLSSVKAIELAEELLKIAPQGFSKVFFSDSGSEAMEVALKISYQYWRNKGYRNKKAFICFVNGYHGDTIGAVSVGGIDLFHAIYKDLLFETYKIPAPYCYRCPFGKSDLGSAGKCCLETLNRLEEILREHSEEICAIVTEPKIYAAGGFILQPPGYLKKVQELAQKYNVHLIVDEVATGFGRTAKMFACEYENVHPDIMAVAKSISGGYLPISATLVTEEIFRAFIGDYTEYKTFFHGHTYTGNPLACAVAIENIRLFKKYRLLNYINKISRVFDNQLKKFYQLPLVGQIRKIGLMCGIEIVKNKDTKEEFPYEQRVGYKICLIARKKGLFIRPLGNVIVLMPHLNINENILKKITDITYSSIQEYCENPY